MTPTQEAKFGALAFGAVAAVTDSEVSQVIFAVLSLLECARWVYLAFNDATE